MINDVSALRADPGMPAVVAEHKSPLKRMAYGYRDDDYFFLKIMDAFPGFTG